MIVQAAAAEIPETFSQKSVESGRASAVKHGGGYDLEE